MADIIRQTEGLRLELKEYPEIEFKWFEKGLQFQVQFIKKDYVQPESPLEQPESQPALQQELQQELQIEYDIEAIGMEVGTKLMPYKPQSSKQQYYLTKKGLALLAVLKDRNS